MESFRYPQFCPVARAAEVLGHRWVLPILRELFIGPQRFGDLRRRMAGVSPSVLTRRLATLERQGVVSRRVLPAPAASTVYELTDRGQALESAFIELIRWGVLMMTPPRGDEHFEPDWLVLAARAFARHDPTPTLSFELRAFGAGQDAVIRGRGGVGGTQIGLASDESVDLCVEGPAIVLLGFLAGSISSKALSEHPEILIEGEAARLAELPTLFDVPSEDRSFRPAPESATQQIPT